VVVFSNVSLLLSLVSSALISVQSSEAGFAYLIKDGEDVSTVAKLNTVANSNNGAKIAITTADTATDIDTADLVAGDYKLYTINGTNNISNASTQIITISTGNTLTGTKDADTLQF
jgi:hypothetical protein